MISRRSAHYSIHPSIVDHVRLKVKQNPSTQHDAHLRQIVRGYLVRTLSCELTFFREPLRIIVFDDSRIASITSPAFEVSRPDPQSNPTHNAKRGGTGFKPSHLTLIPPPLSTCPTNATVPTLHHSTPPTQHSQITRNSQSRVDRTIETCGRSDFGQRGTKGVLETWKGGSRGTSYRYTSISLELVDFSQTRHPHIPFTIERSNLLDRR